MDNGVFLCSISNVISGDCSEDCGYCVQSTYHQSDIIKKYKFKNLDIILKEARVSRKFGALGFCLVTAGRELDDKKCENIALAAKTIKNNELGLHIIACCGRADAYSLEYLKQNGVDSYNHNLETSEVFFPNICTTHSWEERFKTCENTLSVGLGLCSGGIFGLGESWTDRIELLKALQVLSPRSSPINFFIKNSVLPIQQETLSPEEALECVVLAREYLPKTRLMIAGGRQVVFGENQKALFECGINAVVLGDYLTTKGEAPKKDVEMIHSYGLSIATTCH